MSIFSITTAIRYSTKRFLFYSVFSRNKNNPDSCHIRASVCGLRVHLFVSPHTRVWHQHWLRTWRGCLYHCQHPGRFYLWTRACCGTWRSGTSASAPRLLTSPASKTQSLELWNIKKRKINCIFKTWQSKFKCSKHNFHYMMR